MNKVMKAIAAIMLTVAVVCAAGCTKTDDPNNGGNDNGGGNGNAGALNGLFSVSDTQKVRFSQGNLQYQASTNTWCFANNQFDYMGNNNQNISSTCSGWIDLFAWGTSGWDCGNTYYHPWDSECSYDPYNGLNGNQYGPLGEYNLTGDYANSDWGVYNAISNGGNRTGQWRTMTIEEWKYVFLTRNTDSGIRFAKAEVAGVNGVILLPDDWNRANYTLYDTDNVDSGYSSNVIDVENWMSSLQANGAVFLPAAGCRDWADGYLEDNESGHYWSSSCSGAKGAFNLSFFDSLNDPNGWYDFLDFDDDSRVSGLSVRLVCPAK